MKLFVKTLIYISTFILLIVCGYIIYHWDFISTAYRDYKRVEIMSSLLDEMEIAYKIYKEKDPQSSITALINLADKIKKTIDQNEENDPLFSEMDSLYFDLCLTYARIAVKYEELGNKNLHLEYLKKAEEYKTKSGQVFCKIEDIKAFILQLDGRKNKFNNRFQ